MHEAALDSAFAFAQATLGLNGYVIVIATRSTELQDLSGGEVCRILERHGFAEERRRGSHGVIQRRTDTGTITVPVPQHAELKTGALLSIIRQSGLPRGEFEE